MDRREVYESHPVPVLRKEVMKHLNKMVLKTAKETAKKMKKADLVEYMLKNDQHFKHIKKRVRKAPAKKAPAKKADGCPPNKAKVEFATKKGEVGFCAKPKGKGKKNKNVEDNENAKVYGFPGKMVSSKDIDKLEKPKKERSEKQKANDKRLGEMARARAGKKGFVALSENLGDPYAPKPKSAPAPAPAPKKLIIKKKEGETKEQRKIRRNLAKKQK